MDNLDTNPLADSLVYTARLPISWSPRDPSGSDSEYVRVAEHNEHVLRCANLLGEQHRDRVDEESETDSALMRLEVKVNLLLELVAQLDQRTNQIPEATEVRLASGGIEWKCGDTPPALDSTVWINLYIDNRIPDAMKIPARVLTLREEPPGSNVGAKFESLGEMVQEHLEKMIFRHHRRMIAQSKAGE